jgi:hypothetical protein
MVNRPNAQSQGGSGGAAALKIGCGVAAVFFLGGIVLLVGVLSSGCGEAKDVFRAFRNDVKAGKLAELSMEQADDAEMRKAVAASTDQSVSGFETVSSSNEDWMCIHGSITTPSGSKDVDVLASRKGSSPWVVAGSSLALQCKIKRGGPRFVKR